MESGAMHAWPALLLLPVVAAYFAYLLPGFAALIGIATSSINAVTVMVLGRLVVQHGVLRHAVGGWDAPLGIGLRVDGIAALMLLAAAMVSLAGSVYALNYFSAKHKGRVSGQFWPLWLFLMGAINLLLVAADLFNIYVPIELLGVAGVALVTMGGGHDGVAAALRYLLVSLAGSLCYLLGVGLIYSSYATVDLSLLANVTATPAVGIALALMTSGLIFKAGLFPFHFWLPPAHAKAPAPVSAMLSALVVEAAFYLILRLWFELAPMAITTFAKVLLGAMGVAAVLWGSVSALRAERLKMMVAYSTVAQLGYLFLAIPLMFKSGFTAWSGVALLILAHALAKGAMFMTAGTILQAAGHDRIQDLRGTVQRLPLTMITFALAGVSLIGLPPSGGFSAKWLLLNAAIYQSQWWVVVVLLGGSLLTAAYLFRVVGFTFRHDSVTTHKPHVSALQEWPAFALAVAAILLGLFTNGITELLTVGSPMDGPLLYGSVP